MGNANELTYRIDTSINQTLTTYLLKAYCVLIIEEMFEI